MQKTEEQRLRHLEEMVEDIHALLIMGQDRIPGKAEFDRAIRELLKGNDKPLILFKQRGGVIPKTDPESIPKGFRIRGTQQIRNGDHGERPGSSGKLTESRPATVQALR